VTRSRPLARPSRTFAIGKFLSPLPMNRKETDPSPRPSPHRMGRGGLMFGRLVAIDMALLTELAEGADGGGIKMRTLGETS